MRPTRINRPCSYLAAPAYAWLAGVVVEVEADKVLEKCDDFHALVW